MEDTEHVFPPVLERNKRGQFRKASRKKGPGKINNSCDENNNSVVVVDLPSSSGQAETTGGQSTDKNLSEKKNEGWREGRRIVELGLLADQLEAGCVTCKSPLKLINCSAERRYGLGSILYVRCQNCSSVTNINTGKQHKVKSGQGCRIWDINTKLGAGLLHCGLGAKTVQHLFAVLNIPVISVSAMKDREREAGEIIEEIARESCDKAVELEKSLSKGDGGLEISFDAGWQTKKSGRAYNSLSGHASGIGKKSKQVLGFGVRSKYCTTCLIAKRHKKTPRPHKCRRNWSGSSKAMEPDMAVSMLKSLRDKNAPVMRLVMDDDTTTIARVRVEVDASIEKRSDRNHTRKHLTDKLYSLQKEKKFKELNSKTISHFQKCFSYALSKHSGDKESLKRNLQSIPNHAFGDHNKCDASWCKYLQNPDSYVPRNMPYKRYLKDKGLKTELQKLFDGYSEQSAKLCQLGSTQANEAFNHNVSMKAPKNKFYAGSDSLNFRVAAASAEWNMGSSYMTKVNEKMMLSPGKHTEDIMKKTDKKRQRERDRKASVSYKKQRISLKEGRNNTDSSAEVREGTTYHTGVDIECNVGDDDILEIPPATQVPVKQSLCDSEKHSYICFDLETTGLGHTDEIVQVAAVYGSIEFSQYVVPSIPISTAASKVTGLATREHCLYKDGVLVSNAVGIGSCLNSFDTWLCQFQSPVLVAHNALRFDAFMYLKTLLKHGENINLSKKIAGFVDTLPLFKELLPGRKSYSQESLVRETGTTYPSHDALEDVRALQSLTQFYLVSEESILKHSSTIEYSLQETNFRLLKRQNLGTLEDLVKQKIVTRDMANKIAESGLSFTHLKIICKRSGEEGLLKVFKEECMRKPRVTKCSKVAKSIAEYFSK